MSRLVPTRTSLAAGYIILLTNCLLKVRVAVYVQIAFAIILSILAAQKLVTAALRSHLITMYAILIALQLEHRSTLYRYSIQDIVAITITWALVVSSFCSVGESLHSAQIPIVIFDLLATCGGFVWAVALMVESRHGIMCLEVAYPSTPVIAKLPMICWGLSALAIIAMILSVGWPRIAFRRAMFACWLIAWIATMVSAEVSMAIYLFKNVANVELLIGSSWGFGQVMAMVALASQMFGIVNYYSEWLVAKEEGFPHRVVAFVRLINSKLATFRPQLRRNDQEAPNE